MKLTVRSLASTTFLLGFAFFAEITSGMVMVPDSTATDWRFTSGMGTSNPTPNTNPLFVGLGYDWSGIGGTGWGGTSRMHNFALIAPNAIYFANHYAPGVGYQTTFFNNVTSGAVNMTVASRTNPISDVELLTTTQAVSASDHISVLRVLDISSGNYTGQPEFLVGVAAPSGTQQIATARVSGIIPNGYTPLGSNSAQTVLKSTSHGTDPSLTFSVWEGGDSGSPILIPYKGELTIAGAAWLSDGTGSTLLSCAGYDPVTPTNAWLATTGYALRFTIYDVPTDTANTANVWSGGASTGTFGSAANWAKSSAPNNLPVVFDSSSNNGQTAITLGSDQQVRGILFRTNTNTAQGGFSFNAGNTLSIGYSGLRNEDNNTQTFNSNIGLTSSQNWEAVNGNLVFNGAIANNGYLLVVQGAQNTTINGVLSGLGGLAKDDAGVLTLGSSNTYGGTTFLHNGILRLGTSNALPTLTSLIFDVANPAQFDLNGFSQTITEIRSTNNGAGLINVNGGSLITGIDNAAATYAGGISGLGSVTKMGAGTWTLTGASDGFSGSVVVAGGALQLTNSIGSSHVTVNSGATLTGIASIGGDVTLNTGAQLIPGSSGSGTLSINSGLLWNSGGSLLFALNPSNASTLLDLGSSALTKAGIGSYAFTFTNMGGLSTGLYNLMNFGSTNFNLSDFGYTNQNGFTGNFILSSGHLQFQLNNVGSPTGPGGWTNFASTITPYNNASNWTSNTTNNRFTEKFQSGFTQVVQFQSSTTLTGPLCINFQSLDVAPAWGAGPPTKGWYFLSSTNNVVLTLGGDVSANNPYSQVNALLPTIIPSPNVGVTVSLGGINASIAGSGYNLAGIDLGGANRTFSTNLPGDITQAKFGFFVEAPITDTSNSGASATKTGNGNLMLCANNTFTGDLNIQGGIVTLLGNGTLASKNITISGGASLYLSNVNGDPLNGTVDISKRLTATGGPNLTLSGGDIEFAATAGETMTFKTVNAVAGITLLRPVTASGVADATLAMAALNRSAGSTFFMPSLPTTGSTGVAGGYVTAGLINGSTPTTGTVIPWAYTGSSASGNGGFYYSGFVVYNASYGFQPESAPGADTNYLSGTNFSGATAATDYQLTANYALTSNTQVNSLVSGSASSTTLTSAGGPFTLKLTSGGLLLPNGGTIGSTTAANNVLLDFNHQEALIATSINTTTLDGAISNANGMTISASSPYKYSTLVLNFANPFNTNNTLAQNNWGATYINAGILRLQNASALPNTGDVTVNVNTSGISPSFSNFTTSTPAVLDLNGNSVTIGALNGAGMVVLTSMLNATTGVVSGTLTLGNGGDSGSFSGILMNTLLPLLPYGANQGNQMLSYGATTGNIVTMGVVKTDTGTQTFSGINTYTGTTTISGGVLALSGSGTLGINSAVTLTGIGSTFDLAAATGQVSIGSLSGSAGTIVNLGANSLSVGTNNAVTTFAGNIIGTGGGIAKMGSGMLILNGLNLYTGTTTVNSGILRLDHSSTTSAMLSNSSSLIMGGGRLQILGNSSAPVTDAPNGLTVNSGGSTIQVASLGASPTTLAFGAISRNTGGTVDFIETGSSTRIATSTPGGSLLGGWATFNQMTDWAAVIGGNIVAGATIGGAETVASDASAWGTSSANVTSGSQGFTGTTASASTVNSILFNGAGASNITIADILTVNSGGILETAAVGNHAAVITGGILQSGNGQDLIIIQNNTANTLTLGSSIFGMSGLTKSGAGTLMISGDATYYGTTTINAGTIALSGTSATLGSHAPLTVAANAKADLSQSIAIQTFANVNSAGTIVLGAGGMALGSDNSSSTVSGMLTGSGGITKNGQGTLSLSGLNLYTGALMINTGSVAVTGYGTLGIGSDVTINTADSIPAVLDLSNAASAVSIGSLSGAGNLLLSPAGLTIGTNNSSTTFSGDIAGIGGFTKVGSGTLTLTGTNVAVSDMQYYVASVGSEYLNQGTLALDYRGNPSPKINTGNLYMGGGTLMAVGSSTTDVRESSGNCYFNTGASAFNVSTPTGASANVTLYLNGISRTAGGGGTVDFTTNSGGGRGTAAITTTSGVTGVLGGYATVNGMSDWAYIPKSGASVTALPMPVGQAASSADNIYKCWLYNGTNRLFVVDCTGLQVGQTVTGTGIPAGTTITAIQWPGGTVTLSQLVTTSGGSQYITAPAVCRVTTPSALIVGESVTGPNIPTGTTITSISGNIIVLSNNPTGTVSSIAPVGYATGTLNNSGLTIATLDDPSNWTIANYGLNLTKANITEATNSIGFNGTVALNTTINSLRINSTDNCNIRIADGATLTLANGGLLETAAVGANLVNISGGTLATGNSYDLIIIQNNPAAPMTISSAITSYGVTKSGAGTVILSGANTYSGATIVNAGTLALGGSSTVGNGSSAVTVMPGATLDLQGSTSATQSFSSLSSVSPGGGIGGGTVITGSSVSTLTVGSNNAATIFNGVIENGAGSTAGLTKVGTGMLIIGGTNTYAGATSIVAGSIMLTSGSLPGSVAVGNGTAIATLAGTGTMGDVTVNSSSATKYGILSPGTMIGGPFTIQSPGTLTMGNLTFNGPNAQVNFLLGSATLAGSTYSTAIVNGNLTLAGSVLNLIALDAFGPDTYHLFTYTGTETGTLTVGSLPTGYASNQFSLSYGYGSVDLVVSVQALPEPSTTAMLLAGMLGLVALRKRRRVR